MKNKKIIIVLSIIVTIILYFTYMSNSIIERTIKRVLNIGSSDYELEIVEDNMDVFVNSGSFKIIITVNQEIYNEFDNDFLKELREMRTIDSSYHDSRLEIGTGYYDWISDKLDLENIYFFSCAKRGDTLFKSNARNIVNAYVYIEENEDVYKIYMYYSE